MSKRHYPAPSESTETSAAIRGPEPLGLEDWRAAERAEAVRVAREFLANPRVRWVATAGGVVEAQGLAACWGRLFPPLPGDDPSLPSGFEVREGDRRTGEKHLVRPSDHPDAPGVLRRLWAQARAIGEREKRRGEIDAARGRAAALGRIADALRTERRGRFLVGDNGEPLAESEALA